jgi:flavorubredoxin
VTAIESVTAPVAPHTEPQRIAEDTFLIPNLVPAEPGTFVFVNTLVILAEEPVVVDTGAPLHREQWLDAVSQVVDPTDVRWVFLSHDDGDHLGNMHAILDRAPNAKVVANFFSNERAALEPDRALPIDRQVWLEEGTSFDAGDRRLHLFRPPIFDGPTTRGLYDERTGVMWAVDSFAALTTASVFAIDS